MIYNWVEFDEKKYYLDSKDRGLRIRYNKKVSLNVKNTITCFVKYLRKRYFFPIRCNIYVSNNKKYKSRKKGYCFGVFFPGKENKNGLPSIYIPDLAESKHASQKVIFNLGCLLTYYFQWYFYEEKKRSQRSLEIEATKMASYLLDDFLESKYFQESLCSIHRDKNEKGKST